MEDKLFDSNNLNNLNADELVEMLTDLDTVIKKLTDDIKKTEESKDKDEPKN